MTLSRGISKGHAWYQETPWCTLVTVDTVLFASASTLPAKLHQKVQQVNAIGPPPEGSLFGHLKNVVVFPSMGAAGFPSP